MNRTHLSNEQLIAHLYGIADEDTKPHLDACEECQIRWAEIELRRRASFPQAVSAPDEMFVRQRHAVLANAERNATLRSPWLPVGAAALALAGLVLLQPSQPSRTVPPVSEPAPVLEAGWFDEAYATSVSVEPHAAGPLRELFSNGEPMP